MELAGIGVKWPDKFEWALSSVSGPELVSVDQSGRQLDLAIGLVLSHSSWDKFNLARIGLSGPEAV